MDDRQRRIGFYYFPDNRHYSEQDLERWLPVLEKLDAGWLTLQATAERPVPEAFVRGLLDAGIEPIIHIRCPIGSTRPTELNPLLYSYAHWGVRYVVAYDRPNMRSSWAEGQWSRSGLVERFLDTALPTLQAAHSAGLAPMLPPLDPGGDYWDTAFMESALKAIARRGQQNLLDSLIIAAYGWTYGQALDWGAGGPDAWPEARPYTSPDGVQDQRGIRTYEWYPQIAQSSIGINVPTLVLAGGPTDESGRPNPESAPTAFEIRQLIENGETSAEPMAFCFHLLACDEGDPEADFAWYTHTGSPTPIAQSYLEAVEAARAAMKSASDLSRKLFEHYLLLPEEETQAVPAWRNASAFALAHRPVVGFSPQEAAHAEQVTIAGDHELISSEVENTLRAAGCQVQRLTLLPTRKSACDSARGSETSV